MLSEDLEVDENSYSHKTLPRGFLLSAHFHARAFCNSNAILPCLSSILLTYLQFLNLHYIIQLKRNGKKKKQFSDKFSYLYARV
jgi:hypothetical protein